MKILITGGAGFIGSATIRYLLRETAAHVVNTLTYAGNLESLEDANPSERYALENADICDRRELGWRPTETFETGLAKALAWYFDRLARPLARSSHNSHVLGLPERAI